MRDYRQKEIELGKLGTIRVHIVGILASVFREGLCCLYEVSPLPRVASLWRVSEWGGSAFFFVLIQIIQNAKSGSSELVDGNDIAFVEPEPDRSVQLPLCNVQLRQANRFGFWGAHRIFGSWLGSFADAGTLDNQGICFLKFVDQIQEGFIEIPEGDDCIDDLSFLGHRERKKERK